MSLEHSEAGWRAPSIAPDLRERRKGRVDRQIGPGPLFSSSIASRLVHAAAGFEKPRTKEGRLYPNKYTPIPSLPTTRTHGIRTGNLPSTRHKIFS